MATHKLGKLKLNWSEDGLAFRFGDGKIRRLGLGKKRGADEVDNRELYEEDYQGVEEGYDQGEYAADEYSGRFAQPSGGRVVYEDDYDDEYDDGYDDYDDGYDDYDDGYQDEYDDRDYDDGYGDYDEDGEYDSEGYYDEGGEYGDYDDRYSDEDADGYDDAPYAEENAFLRFADEHVWLIYLLLVLLPPLGIYLLWNRRLFERPIRFGVSIASAIIFVLEIILIISLLSGGGDKKTDPQLVLTTPRPTVEAVVESDEDGIPSFGDDLTVDELLDASGTSTGDASGMDALLTADATPTPLPGGATAVPGNAGTANTSGNAEFSSSETVFTTAAGTYYHKNRTCANIGEGSVSIVTMDVALQQSKAACPLCYPNQEEYFATPNGKYYHLDYKCSGMNDAVIITKEAAQEQGKAACPVCITKEVNSIAASGLKYADANTKDKSGMTVYATSGGRYFHVNATCSGMQNAVSGSLLQAMLSGKEPCKTCCSGANSQVWATKNGKYYHNTSDCSGMEGANKITVAEAMILGKSQCSKCWTNTVSGGETSSASGVLVYGTKNGKYYHTNSTCSGMSNANRYTLDSMIKEGRPACPVCATGADTTVYATSGGTYYHSNATCSGMKGAKSGTLAKALASGYKRCPSCWAGTDGAMGGTAATTASGNMVYCTQGGTYYHTKSNCSGMSGASQVDIATALSAGKKACPSCASAATKNVYSTDNGRYYHMTSSCSGMSNAKQRTLEAAISLGQTACPTCLNNYQKYVNAQKAASTGGTPIKGSDTYKSGTSGIKVYATATSKHYHTSSSCSGMTDASKVTLETALNYGKTGCSKCASSANTTVYAVKGSKYYHNSKTCAGAGASKGTRAEALAYGFDACPYCVSKSKAVESSNTYKPGKSGIKVYASISGKYYHTDKVCAGSSASKITLETALNYSKKACPSCIGGATVTVYCNSSDNYYHSSKTCAGSNAVSGQFAKALAMGKKECPVCIGGSEAYEESDIKYSAPGDTKVYIDPSREMLYYHAASRCNDAGLSGGVGGNLEFAIEWGYKACPFCNPPTSVS